MKKAILAVLSVFLLASCSSTKESTRTDKTQSEKSVDRRTITRPGDTVRIDIPNIKFRDTTITRVNYDTRTVASVRYDSQGNQTVECISAEIKELIESIKETQKNDVDESDKKESEFKPQHLFYAMGFMLFMVIVAIVVVLIAMNKTKTAIPGIIANVLKDSQN